MPFFFPRVRRTLRRVFEISFASVKDHFQIMKRADLPVAKARIVSLQMSIYYLNYTQTSFTLIKTNNIYIK